MGRSDKLVLIPAFNEERTIARVVTGAIEFADVMVVNDCSTDKTVEEAENAGAVVISNSTNSGYDKTLERGFVEANRVGYKYIVTFDADGQHDANLLPVYFEYLTSGEFDLVLGRRPEKARFSEQLMGLYFLARFRVHDILCGMKGYNINVYQRCGYFDKKGSIGTALAYWALTNDVPYTEVEVPIHLREDQPRFGNLIKSNYRILRALLKLVIQPQPPKNN